MPPADQHPVNVMHTLVVGPSSRIRSQIARVATERGHTVACTPNAESARPRIARQRFDFIIVVDSDDALTSLNRYLHLHPAQPAPFLLTVLDATETPNPALAAEADGGLLATVGADQLSVQLAFFEHRLRDQNRQLVDALHEQDARTEAILQTTVDAIITIDEEGRIELFNAAAERIFGYSAREIIGRKIETLMPEPYRSEHDGYIERYRRTGEARIIGIGREVRGRRRDGSTFPMDLSVSEIRLQHRRLFTGIVRDISERRKLEQELLRISDQERRRIGQDLHDGLGQMLTGLGLISRSLARRLEADDHETAEEMAEISRLIKEADQQARTLARGLVPVELENNGLTTALQRMMQNAEQLFQITCTFDQTGPLPHFNGDQSLHLYRIAQEAVSNAVKHGNATYVRVELAAGPGQVRLRIQDDGVGFSQDWKQHAGLGVRIMIYRAHLIGATLDILPGPDEGTVISCTLSLNRNSPSHTPAHE